MGILLIDDDSITMGTAVMHDGRALGGLFVRVDDDTTVFAYRVIDAVSRIAPFGAVTIEP